jgi:DNA uptake protein ComE-like DNA-binding protein
MTEKLNLNDAGQEALDTLAELQGHAHEIVRYRNERGGFTDVKQLNEVPGLTGKVGEKTYDQLYVGSG